ncbi:MAG: cytochrome c-type biogenesis protein CcmH [Geminicoccaceae bacterium]|nr:MAG: cytochrome c-type biogenesis protein CcmH [Geminicoccaceae bacterium]
MTLRQLLRALLPALLLALATAATAAPNPDEILDDPALEARARALSAELRCVVCQNESIDDSGAPLARDMRRLVRERLVAGDSDAEVVDFLVARYGDFVRLRPPVRGSTLLLWASPLILVGLGGIGVWLYLRGRRDDQAAAPAPLSPEEQAALDRLLADRSRS